MPLRQVKLYPTDVLEQVCEYDTTGVKNVTLGGEGTNDEMCLTAFRYWPRILYDSRSTSAIPWRTAPHTLDEGLHTCSVPGGAIAREVGVVKDGSISVSSRCERRSIPIPGHLVAHIVLMYLAWVVILPFGVLYPAIWKDSYKSVKLWFAEHFNLQRNGSLLAFLGAAIVMGGITGPHFGSAHQILGMTIVILLAQHILFAVMRPEKVDVDRADVDLDDKISRLLWVAWHCTFRARPGYERDF